jgi:hypothetical protein
MVLARFRGTKRAGQVYRDTRGASQVYRDTRGAGQVCRDTRGPARYTETRGEGGWPVARLARYRRWLIEKTEVSGRLPRNKRVCMWQARRE